MKCEEAVAESPKRLLNEEDVATNWLPDDLDQRRLALFHSLTSTSVR